MPVVILCQLQGTTRLLDITRQALLMTSGIYSSYCCVQLSTINEGVKSNTLTLLADEYLKERLQNENNKIKPVTE
jgi:hypothetical protein